MNSSNKKILIVEDERMLSEMYKDVFERQDFQVVLASTGEEALQVAKSEKPNFILLDIILPEGNGIYFLEKRKKIPEIADIPVVAFSNFDKPAVKKRVLNLGARDYLMKTNYTPQEVVQEVKKYIT